MHDCREHRCETARRPLESPRQILFRRRSSRLALPRMNRSLQRLPFHLGGKQARSTISRLIEVYARELTLSGKECRNGTLSDKNFQAYAPVITAICDINHIALEHSESLIGWPWTYHVGA